MDSKEKTLMSPSSSLRRTDRQRLDNCPYHNNNKLNMYCYTCSQLFCEMCWEHLDHDKDTLEVLNEMVTIQLQQQAEQITNKLTEFMEAVGKMEDSREHFIESTGSAEKYIAVTAEQLKNSIDGKEMQLQRELIVYRNKRLEDAESFSHVIREQLPELEKLLERCEKCQRRQSAVEKEQERRGLEEALTDLQWLKAADCMKPLPNRSTFQASTVENFLHWNVEQLMEGEKGAVEDLEDVLVEEEDYVQRSMVELRKQLERVNVDELAGDEQPVTSDNKMVKELLKVTQSLEKQVNKVKQHNKKLSAALKETKELLEQQKLNQQKERAQQVTTDHDKEINLAIAEVERLLAEKERHGNNEIKCEVPLSVAVIGNSGVGKSSFINAIRHLTADDAGAAAVGVTECTMDITSYPHPRCPQLKFWDLPGVGTDLYPKDTYLKTVRIDDYDFFILMSATRFTEYDTWLGNEITKRGKKYFFVRTKLGLDISNNKKAHPRTHNEQVVIGKILENSREHLKSNGVTDVPVLLIDSYQRNKFDFARLEQMILRDLPEIKRLALGRRSCVIS